LITSSSKSLHDSKTTIASEETTVSGEVRYQGPIGALFVMVGIGSELVAVISHRTGEAIDWFGWLLIIVGVLLGGSGVQFLAWAYEAAQWEDRS
jgi:hypothetical protein